MKRRERLSERLLDEHEPPERRDGSVRGEELPTLEAGRNHPLWITVYVPPEQPAGEYGGLLKLSAEGWSAEVPVNLRVYDFALPPLVLHAIYRGTSRYLRRWLEVSPRNAVTVLDTHDGIGVMGGVDLLRAVALRQAPLLSDRVVVIGGGNVAFDVSRTVIRQAGMDISRTALRAAGVREVHLCCLESLEEMPADDVEIIEGSEEGVKLHPGLGPKQIHLDDRGHVRAVSFKRVLSVFDDQGRFSPKFDENDITTIEADTVLWAIGQQADLSFLDPQRDDIKLTDRGAVVIDRLTQQSSAPDVFVAGDVAHGVGLMIEAIASGKRVARSIHDFLRGARFIGQTSGRHTPLSRFARENDYEKLKRLRAPAARVEQRRVAQNVEVEKTYSEQQAYWEAARCLDCGVNTIFDSSKCVLCGGCVDVCPEGCLRIVSVSRLEADERTQAVLDRLCGDTPRERASAIIKDEARCIRCAHCADRCPVGAITMEKFLFEGKWHAERTERTAV